MALFTITTTAPVAATPDQVGSITITLPHAGSFTFTENDFTTNCAPVYSHPQGHAISKIKIDTLTNVAGSFKLIGTDIIAGQEIDFTDIVSGGLSFVDDSSDATAHTSNFTYFASDVVSNSFGSVIGTISTSVLAEVNAPPVVGDNTETLAYGLTLTFTAAMFTTDTTPAYSDAEGDTPATLKLTSLPTNGTIKYKGKPALLNAEIDFADITSGHLTFVGPTGFTGFGSGSFNFEIADSAGSYSNEIV